MDKINQAQKLPLIDQLFESTKKLIIENLELASIAESETMRSYYEDIALGTYSLFCAHSPLTSPSSQELTNLIGYATDVEVIA
ncbi:MAG: hypothetical protein JKY50_18040 [Oleispira sp.]|nr:hypothetical protein [Oleispira sp.]MBL4880841.1 hypothetical protein [Oleispira sp.]